MHLGNNNPKTTYSLTTPGASLLEPTQAEKDLGVMLDDQLTVTSHVEAAVKRRIKFSASYEYHTVVWIRSPYAISTQP